MAFFTLNIVISTMFLRWHYLIDVIAGLLLAIGAWLLAPRLCAWEHERRARHRLGPIWPTWTNDEPAPLRGSPLHTR